MFDRARLLILAALLAGCTSMPSRVQTVTLPVRQYVPVPAELLKRCNWPRDWPKRRVLESNRIRGACLAQYESQLQGIESLKAP